MNKNRLAWSVGVILLLLVSAGKLGAHELGTSYIGLTADADTCKVNVSLDNFDMLKIGLDQDGDGALSDEEMTAGLDQLFAYVERDLSLRINDQPVALVRDKGEFVPDGHGNTFGELHWEAVLAERTAVLAARIGWPARLGDNHKTIARIFLPGQSRVIAVFSAEEPEQTFVSAETKSQWEQVRQFIFLGGEHIFIGYDHILFLLALIVVGGRLLNLVKIVTSFTVAHSITLCVAGLGLFSPMPRWIEIGIALSIIYVGLENFWIKRIDRRWILTFIFGLVHGFGFANVLREVGLPTKGLVFYLLSFNIGVEIGQVAIVALIFPLVAWLGRQPYQRTVVLVVSVLVVLFGLGWLIERIFGLEYMPL